jgi:mono/diheme cytochrome c family protein
VRLLVLLSVCAATVSAAGRPALPVEDVIFAARFAGQPNNDSHWYANFGYFGPDESRKVYSEGGKLYRLNLASRRLTTLLADPKGGVRDPQVHYDGGKILFSYRKGGTGNYRPYEIDADGSHLKQLTDGAFDDMEPTYLASGDIVLVSTRCKRWVNCWLTQVAIMHRCDADGGNIHAVSSNLEQDNTPWPLPDGRLLYTRWEYIDRSQVDYHHLWAMNPDGTGQAVYFGNLHPGNLMIDAKPIPGSHKVVAIFAPGHGSREHTGRVEVVDPRAGPDDKAFARQLTAKPEFRDPWAFSERLFMAAHGTSLVAMNDSGEIGEVSRLPAAGIAAKMVIEEPRPLASRPRERRIPSRTEPAKSTGTLLLTGVYKSRNMQGVRPGEIKKLLVMESLPMPISFQGWLSCASCHGPEAPMDGLNWDLLNDGIGNASNAKSLLLSHRTPPAMSHGVRANAEAAVRAGIARILFAERPEAEAVAIDEYRKALRPVPSPFLMKGKPSAAALRGKRLFFDGTVGCSNCHPAGLYTTLGSYDLGAGSLDTPTLVEVWRTTPYLRNPLTTANPHGRHGQTSHLTPAQIDDLLAYLLTL